MSSNINEVKSIIRGLLVSCPVEMTVSKLRHDYRDQEGLDIPFYEYKFHDVTSFLRSIPDVCQIVDNPYGPHAIVRLVESEKSAHVSSLVMRQKSSRKPRRKHFNTLAPTRPSYKIPHSSKRTAFRQTLSKIPYCESSLTSSRKPQVRCGTSSGLNVSAPEFNLGSSYSFSGNSTQDISPLKSEVSSSEKIQDFITLDPAVEELQDFISWEPDVEDHALCKVEKNFTRDPDFLSKEIGVRHLIELHLLQILTNTQGLSFDQIEQYLNASLFSNGMELSLDKDEIKYIVDLIPNLLVKNGVVFYLQSTDLIEVDSSTGITGLIQENRCCEMNAENTIASLPMDENCKVVSYPIISPGGNEKVQRLERNLYSLMKDFPNGILASELMEKYKLKFAAPLNLQILGYKSLEELVSKMTYIFTSVNLENGDVELFPTWLPNALKAKSKKNDTVQNSKAVVPLLIKRNVQWLIQGYPNGLNSRDFLQTYKDTFYGDVELTEMGFSSLIDFLNRLEKEGIIQICISDSDTWLLPAKSPVEMTVSEDPLPSLELEDDFLSLKEKFPNDVVGPDKHIEQLPMPPWVQTGSMIEIYIQELLNPHNFWVTFVGEQYTSALNVLMDELQAFYCSKSHSYRIDPTLVRKGQDCVTLYSGEWNRGRVVRFVNSNEVEVFFFDYGTQSVVQGNALYYLHNSFAELPAQAIRAMLSNISPIGDEWSKDASKRFLSLIADRPLIGIVHSVDRQSCILSLFLCDTNSEEDIYISNILVAEGYALATDSIEDGSGEKNITNIKNEVTNGVLLNNLLSTDNAKSVVMDTHEEAQEEVQDQIKNENVVTADVFHTSTLEKLDFREKLMESNIPNLNDSQAAKTPLPNSSSFSFNENFNKFDNVGSSVLDKTISEKNLRSNDPTEPISVQTDTHIPNVLSPRGFSNVLQNKMKISYKEEKKSPTTSSCFVGSQDNVSDTQKKEVLKPGVERDNGFSASTNFKRPPKSVNSGVNANFTEEFKTYAIGGQTYGMVPPGWVPPMYPNMGGFNIPPFIPMDPTLPISPYALPPLPNPLDFYSMWYYEQMRQQAIMRGAIAHQHFTASLLPQLPGGLFLPSRNPQPFTGNQMLISELNSPPPQVDNKTGSDCAGNSAGTQTEDVFDDDDDDDGDNNQPSQELSSLCENSILNVASTTVNKSKILYDPLSDNTYERCIPQCSIALQTFEKDSDVSQGAISVGMSECTSKTQYIKKSIDNECCESKLSPIPFQESVHSSNQIKSSNSNQNNKTTLQEPSKIDSSSLSNPPMKTYEIKECSSSENMETIKSVKSDLELLSTCNGFKPLKIEASAFGDLTQSELSKLLSTNNKVSDTPNEFDVDLSENNLLSKFNEKAFRRDSGIESDVLSCNVSLVCKDDHSFDSSKVKSEELMLSLSSDISYNTKNSKGDKFCKQSHMCNETLISHSTFSEKNLKPTGNQENNTKIILNPFSTTADSMAHDKNKQVEVKCSETSQPNTEVGTCRVEIKYNSSDLINMKDRQTQNSEFETFQENISIAHADSELNISDDLQNDIISSVPNYNGNSKQVVTEDDDYSLTTSENAGGTDNLIVGVSSTYQNKQSNVKVTKNSVTAELLDSLMNVHIQSREKREFIFSNHDITPSVKKSIAQVNKYTASHQKRKESSVFESNVAYVPINIEANDEESKSKFSYKFTDHSLARVQSTIHSDNLLQLSQTRRSGATAKVALVTDVPRILKKSSPVDCTATSWTTTWGTENSGQTASMKPDPKYNNNASPHSLKEGSIRYFDYSSQNPKEKPRINFVKKTKLLEHEIHLINLDGRPYVPTDEIIRNFTTFNGHHVVLKILDARKVEINFLELCRKRRPDIFDHLDKSDIKYVTRGPAGNIIGSLHIVPLRSVPYMLKALNRDNATMTMVVQDVMTNFNPNDSYWQGHSK